MLCNSRAQLLPSLSRPPSPPSPLCSSSSFSSLPSSSPSFVFPRPVPFSLHIRASVRDCLYLPRFIFSLFFYFLLSLFPSFFPLSIHRLSMYDATKEGIFNPANHQQGIENRAQAFFSYMVLPFLFFGMLLITSRLLAERASFIV